MDISVVVVGKYNVVVVFYFAQTALLIVGALNYVLQLEQHRLDYCTSPCLPPRFCTQIFWSLFYVVNIVKRLPTLRLAEF